MTESIADTLLNRAWREFLDPGTPWRDLEAAAVVLKRDHRWTENRLGETGVSEVLDLAPDRLGRLAQVLHPGDTLSARPAFASAIVDAFGAAHEAHLAKQTLFPLRRAHALLELVARFENIAAELPAAGLAWLYANDEYALPDLLLPIQQWCVAHDPIPEVLIDAVRELRADEPYSPGLDRLAAWVAPSPQGMLDLAAWENGFRCHEPAWKEAVARWERGEHDAVVDGRALCDTTDAERSVNAFALKRALERHPAITRSALREARDQAAEMPIVQTILAAWISAAPAGAK